MHRKRRSSSGVELAVELGLYEKDLVAPMCRAHRI